MRIGGEREMEKGGEVHPALSISIAGREHLGGIESLNPL